MIEKVCGVARDKIFLYTQPQFVCFFQRVGVFNVAFVFCAAHQHLPRIFDVEEVQAEPILGYNAVEQLG